LRERERERDRKRKRKKIEKGDNPECFLRCKQVVDDRD
jgi:hypothetical protein